MNRPEALALVREYIHNENLLHHMLAVEAAMRYYAAQYGEDQETWGVAGLLHDFDWEIHPNAEQHPSQGAPILRERGVPETIVRAILSHGSHTGIARETRMEKALSACDEITGLITAVALVRPSRSLLDLEVSSVKKKWKDKAFAAGANREEIAQAAEEFGVPLWEHTANVIEAMRGIAGELGLAGQSAQFNRSHTFRTQPAQGISRSGGVLRIPLPPLFGILAKRLSADPFERCQRRLAQPLVFRSQQVDQRRDSRQGVLFHHAQGDRRRLLRRRPCLPQNPCRPLPQAPIPILQRSDQRIDQIASCDLVARWRPCIA
jgi:putative nucleotidyltransferase with HDIG domain